MSSSILFDDDDDDDEERTLDGYYASLDAEYKAEHEHDEHDEHDTYTERLLPEELNLVPNHGLSLDEWNDLRTAVDSNGVHVVGSYRQMTDIDIDVRHAEFQHRRYWRIHDRIQWDWHGRFIPPPSDEPT